MDATVSVLQSARQLFARWQDRCWFAMVCGLGMALCLPPLNHQTHWLLAPLPLLSVVVLLPLFAFASHPRTRRAVLLSWLYGVTAAGSQYYWIVFDTAEGVWHLIILGVVLLCAFFGSYYLGMGMLFRLCRQRAPRLAWALFPALWVVGEYLRTLGDISFPWTLIGYSWAPILPLAQLASLGGVYLLSYVVVAGNVVLWDLLTTPGGAADGRRVAVRRALGYAVVAVLVLVWGGARMLAHRMPDGPEARVCCLQVNFDPLERGRGTLDSAFAVAESLVYHAAQSKPDLLVLPESALLCYLVRKADRVLTVTRWVDSVDIPLVLGALHWERGPKGSPYKHMVYNTAFLVDPVAHTFTPYFKIKLVPFSEELPFEGAFPALSRVNLGEADFKRGRKPVVFTPTPLMRAVPFICYEVIYPNYVRRRLGAGGNVLLNITNDGWFGKSPGPYHHASMVRLRCIENGVSMVRCANTGISMLVDQYGRTRGVTRMFERAVLCGQVSLERRPTLYSALGDWVVWCSVVGIAAWVGVAVWRARQARRPE